MDSSKREGREAHPPPIEPIEISDVTEVLPNPAVPAGSVPRRSSSASSAARPGSAPTMSPTKEAERRGPSSSGVDANASNPSSASNPSKGSTKDLIMGPGVIGRPPMDELVEKTDLVVEMPRVASSRLRYVLIAVLALLTVYLFASGRGSLAPTSTTAVHPALRRDTSAAQRGTSATTPPGGSETEVEETSRVAEGSGAAGEGSGAATEGSAPSEIEPSRVGEPASSTSKVDEVPEPRPPDEVTIRFNVTPKNARMLVNGRVHRGDLVVPRGPNEYTILFTARGHEDQVFRLTGERSASFDVELPKTPAPRGRKRPK